VIPPEVYAHQPKLRPDGLHHRQMGMPLNGGIGGGTWMGLGLVLYEKGAPVVSKELVAFVRQEMERLREFILLKSWRRAQE
jgi:hypothetical protein